MRATDNGRYYGNEVRSFWIMNETERRIGLIRLFDLSDPTPMFDLRIKTSHRGRGIGAEALRWLTDFVFETMPDKIRIEGYTRRDNRAMRRVFRKCGYVKEAHHRKSWPSESGIYYDSVGYGITRYDWKNNITTPVEWNDE